MLYPFVVLDRAAVGEGEPTHGSGARCHECFRERWTILSISVVIRSCAIPVAWKVLGGHEKGSWRPHWEGLLKHLEGSIPADWQVLVLADRGLYARWLFQAICACGWHPFLRINLGVKARVVGEETFDWIGRWVPAPGTSWKGSVECFAGKASRLTSTLLMHWEAGYEHPWAVLTDGASSLLIRYLSPGFFPCFAEMSTCSFSQGICGVSCQQIRSAFIILTLVSSEIGGKYPHSFPLEPSHLQRWWLLLFIQSQ